MPESGTYGSVRGVPGDGHPYRDPCCTLSGADPDTNRSAGLHSIAVLGRRGRHAGLSSSPAAGLTCQCIFESTPLVEGCWWIGGLIG